LTAAGKLRKITLTEAAAVSYWDTCRADDQTKSLPKAKVKNSKSKKVKTAFVYFNNTAAVSALNNAMYLKQFVGEFKKNALVDSVAGK